jgi:hypothetical protein
MKRSSVDVSGLAPGAGMKQPHQKTLAAVWIAAVVFNFLLLFLYYQGPGAKDLVGDESRYVELAHEIASGGPTEWSPIWPPGYEHMLAVPFFVANALGVGQPLLFAQLLQIVAWAFSGVLLSRIAQAILPSRRTQVLTVALYLLYPTLTAFSHYFWPEIPHLFAFLAALWILTARAASPRWHFMLGVSLAAASLLKLVYLPVSVVLAFVPITIRYRHAARLIPGLLSPLVFFGLLSPIALYSYRVHGRLMVADSAVVNTWIGLTDQELTDWHPNSISGREILSYLQSAPTHLGREGIYLARIHDLVREQGPFETISLQVRKQYFRLLDHRTFFTKQLPNGMRPRYPFSECLIAPLLRCLNDLAWAIILLGSGVGIVYTLVEPRSFSSLSWRLFLLAVVAYNLLIFLFLHVKTRYVLAFLPMLCLLSAAGIDAFIRRCLSRESKTAAVAPPTWGTIIAGVSLSLVLLGLAFRDVLLP